MEYWILGALVCGVCFEIASLSFAQNGAPQVHVEARVSVLERTKEPLLKADKPWEDFRINYVTVIRVGDQWRMWYEALDSDYRSDNDTYYCYAVSSDGQRWDKPDLGIVEYKGSKNNNIVMSGAGVGGIHGISIFHDPAAEAAERFKLVFIRMLKTPPDMSFGDDNPDWQVIGAVSPDGIHWKELEKPLMMRLSDSQHACFFDGGVYRLYCRMWRTDGRGEGDKRRRVIGYTESRKFGDFPSPRQIFAADEQDPDDMDFYNSATAKVRDDLYLMFPSGFTHDDDLVQPHLAGSCDGKSFERLNDHKPILPLGSGFDSRGIYVCPGAIAGDLPNTWWVYYLGTDFKHGESHPGRIKSRGGIGRALIEVRVGADPSSK